MSSRSSFFLMLFQRTSSTPSGFREPSLPENRRLLRQIPQTVQRPLVHRHGAENLAIEQDFPVIRSDCTDNHIKGCGLAGSVRPSSPTTSPVWTEKLTFLTAVLLPYDLPRCRVSSVLRSPCHAGNCSGDDSGSTEASVCASPTDSSSAAQQLMLHRNLPARPAPPAQQERIQQRKPRRLSDRKQQQTFRLHRR